MNRTYLTLALEPQVPPSVPAANVAKIVQDLLYRHWTAGAVQVIPARHIELEDVRNFHNKFGVPMSPVPALLDTEAVRFRIKFMQEELKEFIDCHDDLDLHGAADALIDLAYVVIGTALFMGLPWQSLWAEVQGCNMQKRLAKPDGSDSKRGSPLDVVKPEGWLGPDHSKFLGPEDELPPIFNASAYVLRKGQERQDPNLPTVAAESFVERLERGTK